MFNQKDVREAIRFIDGKLTERYLKVSKTYKTLVAYNNKEISEIEDPKHINAVLNPSNYVDKVLKSDRYTFFRDDDL